MSLRTTALACILVGALAGFFAIGETLYKTAIDLDAPAFFGGATIQATLEGLGVPAPRSLAGPFWIASGFLAVLVISFVAGRRARVRATDPARRRLLTGVAAGAGLATLGTVAAAASAWAKAFRGLGKGGKGWEPTLTQIFGGDVVKTHPDYREAWKGARIRGHRVLGRTGWRISDVVLGSARIAGEKGTAVVRAALDRGVNYIDTAPDYSAAGSEQAIGNALVGRRDQVFVATKFCTPRGHLGAHSSVALHKRVIEESLGRLGTDYVDLVHLHSCDEVERIQSENVLEAFDRLREEGKARFLGFSSHTPRLVEVADAAIASGHYDVMMLAYHHGIWPEIPDIIRRARALQDMGVVAMKTLKGAKHANLVGFQEDAEAYSQAALKWALSNPDVSAAIISFFEFQHVDEYLYASGAALAEGDLALLSRYDQQVAGSYCAPHCGACLSHCPEGVPIHDVLRQRMYFEDYGDEKEAMRLYAGLETNASPCAACSAPCLGSCPLGIDIKDRTSGAHDLLRLG